MVATTSKAKKRGSTTRFLTRTYVGNVSDNLMTLCEEGHFSYVLPAHLHAPFARCTQIVPD